MSKGSRNRTKNHAAFRSGWARAFGESRLGSPSHIRDASGGPGGAKFNVSYGCMVAEDMIHRSKALLHPRPSTPGPGPSTP